MPAMAFFASASELNLPVDFMGEAGWLCILGAAGWLANLREAEDQKRLVVSSSNGRGVDFERRLLEAKHKNTLFQPLICLC